MREISGITPLRALAAGLVLMSHVAFWTGASGLDGIGRLLARGDCGVAVFFAVSAFLLLRPALAPERPWPPNRYAAKRIARIAPAYWVALCGVLAVAATTHSGLGGAWKVLRHVLLLQGFTSDPYQGFTQSWSLTTEACFYLLVPLVGRFLRRCWVSGRSPVLALLAVGAIGVAVQAWSASRTEPAFGALTTSVLGHAAWFVVGIGVLWHHRSTSVDGARSRFTPGRACGVAATAYVLAATSLGGPVGLTHPSWAAAAAKEVLYAIIAGCLVHAASSPLSRRVSDVVSAPPLQLAGEVSYGVFLWHVLIIQALFLGLGLTLFHASFALVLIPTVVFSVALAWCSWRFVEQPAIAWAHRPTAHETTR